ncbi:hypothetical protein M0811_12846 [Anaeramoeba ignava]|uniref:t-SNARE coiled-coil homology domain-containing protein n=1 Tax=Anaeramoeba ignava TaxID=1746090 RepID=A0A9Q0R503_ANAIG|nr:hypothetical protein M0811_12846 [Anaeramoeba ignava]
MTDWGNIAQQKPKETLEEISDQIFQIDKNNRQLEEYIKQIGKSKDDSKLRSNLQKIRNSSKKLVQSVNEKLMKEKNNQTDKHKWEKLFAQFNDVLKNFENLFRESVRKEREVIQILQDKEDKKDHDHDNEFQIQEVQNFNQTDLELIEERNRDLQNLEVDVQELHELFIEVAALVKTQQSGIDQVEHNVESADHDVEKGVEELQKASLLQKAARSKMCWIIICVIIIAVIFMAIFIR